MTTTFLASFPSPSQGVWHLGPLPIRAYAFFIIAGIVLALIIGERRWQQRGGEPGTVYDMVFWAVGFGLIGGRLYHVITDWDKYFTGNGPGILGALRIWDGGLGIWGAVALGGVGAWIGCRRRGIPLPAFGDAIAPGIILAQAIGRLGNYFNQELYGGPTTLPWGLEIYERRDASGAVSPHLVNGVSTGQLAEVVHPTFLYELLWNLLVFAALIYIDRRFKIGHGRLFAMYVAGYCFGRFWIELMRVDEANGFAGIRINSFTSTFVFIGAVIYIMAAPKGREDPATLKGTPTEAEDKAKDTEEEETSIEEFVKELTGVAATTTGLVAAAKVAGEAEDEDAKAAADEETEAESEEAEGEGETHSAAAAEAEALAADVAEAPSEEIAEAEEFAEAKAEAEEAEAAEEEAEEADAAEELGADVAGVPADDIAEAEEFAAEGEEEPEAEVETHSEAAAEAEALAEDVAEAPSEEIAEAEEFAEAKAEAEEAESVSGVGFVEGEEAVAAEEAAPEAHDAAVEAAEEAEDVAAEVTDAAADEEPQPEAESVGGESAESEDVAAEVTDAAADDEPQAEAESVGGVGAVEGEEVVAAEEAAPEAHDAAVEAAEEAEDVAAEVTDTAADDEPQGDAELVGGVGAVEGEEVVAAEEAAPEAHDAAVEAAEEAEDVAAEVTDAAADEEPQAGADDEPQPELEESIEAADEAEAGEAEAAVEEAEGEPSEEEAAEVAEAVVAEAEAIEEQEPETQVLADEGEPESTDTAEPAKDEPKPAHEPAEESGGRLRRWLRGRRDR